ncbi:polysaccharide biosynthesis C-terminal domain-containing protein [Halomarina rubra]|uniref:Polysaccharide biosynthesis C-terminal domain-containing protein n=1 Tax=Halomarina rubra TaxID=2071873 RepID=A0ABD6AW50_9EURY
MDSAKRNFVLIFSSKFVGLLMSIIATPVIVRILGPRQYGQYAVVLSMVVVTMIVTNMGMFDGIRKHIGEKANSAGEVSKIFGLYTRVSIFLMLIVASLLLVGTYFGIVRRIFGQEFELYFYISSIMICGRQLFRLARGALIGLDLTQYSESIQVFRQVIFPILAIALTIYFEGVVGVLVADILAYGLSSLLGLFIVARTIPSLRTISTPASTNLSRRKIIKFNTSTVVLVSLVVSLYHADILLLQFFNYNKSIGYYKSALVIAEFLWFVPVAIQTSILHSISKLWDENKTKKITEIASRITRHVVTFSLLMVIGIAVLAEPLITVYFGQEFSASILPLLILLPGAFGYAVIRPIYTIGQSTGNISQLVVLTAIAAIVNAVLNVLLIPKYGIVGAALATSIGYGSMLILHIYGAIWIGFNPVEQIYPGRILMTAVCSATPIYMLSLILPGIIFKLLIVPPVGFLIYSGVAVFFGLLTDEELKAVKRKIQDMFKSFT